MVLSFGSIHRLNDGEVDNIYWTAILKHIIIASCLTYHVNILRHLPLIHANPACWWWIIVPVFVNRFYTILVKLVRKQCLFLSDTQASFDYVIALKACCFANIVNIDESNTQNVAAMKLTHIYLRIFHDQCGMINHTKLHPLLIFLMLESEYSGISRLTSWLLKTYLLVRSHRSNSYNQSVNMIHAALTGSS